MLKMDLLIYYGGIKGTLSLHFETAAVYTQVTFRFNQILMTSFRIFKSDVIMTLTIMLCNESKLFKKCIRPNGQINDGTSAVIFHLKATIVMCTIKLL